jgi:hypothetical protein
MIPVRTNRSNFVYRGPTPDIGDAWVERRRPREVYLTWKPSDAERAAIAAGALIELGIHGMEPIPPVSLNVGDRPELSAEGATLRDQARAKLQEISAGPSAAPAGHWMVSSDVWGRLNSEQALDTSGTGDLPLLWGRPLMEIEGADYHTLEYAVALDNRPPTPPDPPRDREMG